MLPCFQLMNTVSDSCLLKKGFQINFRGISLFVLFFLLIYRANYQQKRNIVLGRILSRYILTFFRISLKLH